MRVVRYKVMFLVWMIGHFQMWDKIFKQSKTMQNIAFCPHCRSVYLVRKNYWSKHLISRSADRCLSAAGSPEM